MNRGLLFAPGGGTAGWLAFPFFVIVEWFGPFVEVAGYLFTIYLLVTTGITIADVAIVYSFAIVLSVFLSTVGFLMDEITFPGSTRIRDVFVLVLFSFIECFGYRQLNTYYRLRGALAWMTGAKSTWGSMSRSGSWTGTQAR